MFIKIKTIGQGGKLSVLVRVSSIISIMEAKSGCQILLPGGDFLPVTESFEEVERKIEEAISGSTENVAST